MEWAKNHLGEDVQARRGTYWGPGLVCPTCGEPVYLRAGKARRPHFAHYSNRARPDCEYYYPPPHALKSSVSRRPTDNSTLSPRRDSLLCGLFLAHRSDSAGFELFVRIPSLPPVEQLKGNLEIRHGLGVKTLQVSQLARSYVIPILPKVPLLECDGTGDLAGLAHHIKLQADAFSGGMNLFLYSERPGRFLFPQESLEYGERYWVVTDSPVSIPRELETLIEWREGGSLSHWHIYEVELLEASERWHTKAENIASEWFGRPIRRPRPRVHIAYPLPHHMAPDGAYVYPIFPEVLYVRMTSPCNVTLDGEGNSASEAVVNTLEDGWAQIIGNYSSPRDVALVVDGVEQALVRIEDCDLIQPDGLVAYTEGVCWNLLTPPPLTQEQLFSREITVECGNRRLAEYVAKRNNHAVQDREAVRWPDNSIKRIDAGGFGGIELKTLDEDVDQDLVRVTPKTRWPKIVWLENLVRGQYGHLAATMVREYIEAPSQEKLRALVPLVRGGLMAHIRAAAES